MADTTKIEWCDSTWNPVIGCTKISPACDHCYAETLMDKRHGRVTWGGPRVRTKTWADPLRWQKNHEAFFAENGRRRRVFCASLADVFDNQWEPLWRSDFWDVVRECPDLDWLLLTKRPQNIAKMLPAFWGEIRAHVWLGVSTENQGEANRRLPHLLDILPRPAVFFASAEPLLGPVDFSPWLSDCYECGASCGLRLGGPPKIERCVDCGEECGPETVPHFSDGCPKCSGELEFICPDCGHYMVYQHPDTPCLSWIITGGETGTGARPTNPEWFREIRDQCAVAGVSYIHKQNGDWVSVSEVEGPGEIFEFEGLPNGEHNGRCVRHVGKKKAGRLLDGVTHDGFPAAPLTSGGAS